MRYGRTDNEEFMPDPRDLTDREILEALVNLGIEITIDDFKVEALSAGSPEVLAGNWAYMYRVGSAEEEAFLYGAIFELWKRHLGYQKKTSDILAEFIDDIINTYEESPEEHGQFFLLNVYERIREFYHKLLIEDGTPDIELYSELSWQARHDFEGFLLSLPHDLARNGLIDEAVHIGRWFAELSSRPDNFLRDTGCILAEAGRREDAILQVEENILRFSDNIWVVINAGDAMYSLGEKKSAERYFLRAKEMAETKNDKMGVLERLLDLYSEMGLVEKAEAIEMEIKVLTLPRGKVDE